MSLLRFTKMHGLGNDYLYFDAISDPSIADRPDLPALAVSMSDRRRGVGSDGIIIIQRPSAAATGKADIAMRMFNADGSEGEMCGNGIRCVAKFVVDHQLAPQAGQRPLRVETGAGILSLEYERGDDGLVSVVTVDMGAPILDLPRIPVDPARLDDLGRAGGAAAKPGGQHRLTIDAAPGRPMFDMTFVSMGNPHAVIFTDGGDEVAAVDLERIGPTIERHRAFPRRINVHFVQVVNREYVIMRTWERGSGITHACGTGAAAVCVASALRDKTGREITTRLPGGELRLRWDESTGHVWKTGPAVEIFSGEWDPDR